MVLQALVLATDEPPLPACPILFQKQDDRLVPWLVTYSIIRIYKYIPFRLLWYLCHYGPSPRSSMWFLFQSCKTRLVSIPINEISQFNDLVERLIQSSCWVVSNRRHSPDHACAVCVLHSSGSSMNSLRSWIGSIFLDQCTSNGSACCASSLGLNFGHVIYSLFLVASERPHSRFTSGDFALP